MTTGEKLLWELFLMVRELMPVTADNTARQNEWARIFHELEYGATAQPRPDTTPPNPARASGEEAARAAREFYRKSNVKR